LYLEDTQMYSVTIQTQYMYCTFGVVVVVPHVVRRRALFKTHVDALPARVNLPNDPFAPCRVPFALLNQRKSHSDSHLRRHSVICPPPPDTVVEVNQRGLAQQLRCAVVLQDVDIIACVRLREEQFVI